MAASVGKRILKAAMLETEMMMPKLMGICEWGDEKILILNYAKVVN